MLRFLLANCLVAVLFANMGCAVMEKDNRRTLNALDESYTPATEAGRWAAAPLAFPAGVLALVADVLIVHPSTVFDDAWGDTVEMLWTPRDETRFRRAVMLPLVTLATPFVYLGDWLGRAALPIPPRGQDGADGVQR